MRKISAISFFLTTLLSLSAYADVNLMSVNQEIRRNKAFPLRWIHKNGSPHGTMNSGEMACYREQKEQFDRVAGQKEATKALAKMNVQRMTFNLYSKKQNESFSRNDPVAGFVWGAPRQPGAFGGNYLIVRFFYDNQAPKGERCKVTKGSEIVAAIKAAQKNKSEVALAPLSILRVIPEGQAAAEPKQDKLDHFSGERALTAEDAAGESYPVIPVTQEDLPAARAPAELNKVDATIGGGPNSLPTLQ